MNDEQLISYYRGCISKRKHQIGSLKDIIEDATFEIKQLETKISALEQSPQTGPKGVEQNPSGRGEPSKELEVE